MLRYHLFAHDGRGNFESIEEFDAIDDDAAKRRVWRWQKRRELELWQSGRKVHRWD